MSFFAKSAVALGFVSLVAAEDCNGVSASGVTLPADVCLNAVEGDMTYSYMYTCDDDDMGLYNIYLGADCDGDAFMSNSTEDMGLNMTCGGSDCTYVKMTSYDFDYGSSTTYSPNGDMSTTDDMSTTEDIDCDDYDFDISYEIAYVQFSCDEYDSDDMSGSIYLDMVCAGGDVYMTFHINDSTCSNTSLFWAMELDGDGACSETECDLSDFVDTDDSPDGKGGDDTDDDDVDDSGDDAVSMNHLVALCFALVAFVAGN